MYNVYIDESGYVQNYHKDTHHNPEHRYFVLGGIIVDINMVKDFNHKIDDIIGKYFIKSELQDDFKLSYHELRIGKKKPFSNLDKNTRYEIANDVFESISKFGCHLISACIDLDYIYRKYIHRIPQRSLALSFLSERYQYFLLEKNDRGRIIHEYVTSEINKSMQTNYGSLYTTYNLPKSVAFENIDTKIIFARASEEPILQLSDFFAYSVLIRARSHGKKQDRWKSISHKYYNLNHPVIYKRGNSCI